MTIDTSQSSLAAEDASKMADEHARTGSNSEGAEPLDVSVIVPALNEAENIPLLVPRIDAALAGKRYEILIVDDNSKDATPQVCAELANKYPVQLLVRTKPTNGLSGAVLHGAARARGQYLVVMDADLQHPPEKLPELLAPLVDGSADFTIGSRYVAGGSTEAEWGLFRKVNSQVATLLARPFAGKVSDPMSGFFALRRSTYLSAQQLTPLGYKIALELMCKCRVKTVREIPIHFSLRAKGESKLSLKQQFRYLEHLSRLYDFKYPRLSPISKFFVNLLISWVVALAFYIPMREAGVGRVRAPVIAYVVAIAVTALLHVRYVRTQREFIVSRHPWLDFTIISLAELLACGLSAWWINIRVNNPCDWEMLVIPFGCATIVRYVMRKELMGDLRGLRREPRREEMSAALASSRSANEG
jgi:dolichol-phosphate mannosyltransferase